MSTPLRSFDLPPRLEQSGPLDFTRWAASLLAHNGHVGDARAMFRAHWPASRSLSLIERAVSAPGTTTDADWAAPLAPLRTLADEFVALVRPATVVGRLAGAREVPPNTRVPRATQGGSVGWVGETKPIGVSELKFDEVILKVAKLAGIVVLSQELVRLSTPAALKLIQADLIAAVREFTDRVFLDPSIGETADNPAAITASAPAIPSSGLTAGAIQIDLSAMFAAITSGLTAPFIVLKPSTALHMASLTEGGAAAFPGIGPTGGSVWGVPALVSESVGDRIVGIDASQILLADGGIGLDTSHRATLLMDNAPAVGAAAEVSLWQKNLVGLRVIRYLWWERAVEGSVAYISGVTF